MPRIDRKHEGQSWFYHAPHKHQPVAEPLAVPPSSQIPGLNGEPVEELYDEPPRAVIRETDSDYVRLAKMGGRADLLRTRDPKPRNEQPVGYPRPDWFYLEDNRREDEEQREQQQREFQFLLPDYMVHQQQAVAGAESTSHSATGGRRHPFAHSDETAAEREGGNLRDKTVRIPETRKPGYGVRSAKMAHRPVQHQPIQRRKVTVPQPELEPRQRYMPMPATQYEQTEARPMMSKLMSHAYAEQWHEEQNQWRHQQDVADERKPYQPPEKTGMTEYQESTAIAGEKAVTRTGSGRIRAKPKSNEDLKNTDKLEKELFQLSKFKKVGPRVDTRRPEWLKPGQQPLPAAAP